MKLSKLSALAALLLSNTVLAQSYQSFSNINYSHNTTKINEPTFNYFSESKSSGISVSSQYYFAEQEALGPLNEFSFMNTDSFIYVDVGRTNFDDNYSYQDISRSSDSNNDNITLGGEWIVNNFILGADYNYRQNETKWSDYRAKDSSNLFSAKFGYLFSDDFSISARFFDDTESNLITFNASYNWQLAGTDYVGFSYDVDEDFELHILSSRYFFSMGEQSYLALGGKYHYFDGEYESDSFWAVNADYYLNASTSISASYDENDAYNFSVNHFFNDNYALRAGYNSIADGSDVVDSDGYSLTFTAQF